ncbi:MAG: CRISPR-associated helicase Cas3' [Verrucomicrobiota bacterium]
MYRNGFRFWAKTTKDGQPGISVYDHCLNVGCVAEVILAALPSGVRGLLPAGAISLAALHDIGKITIGFQIKCPLWRHQRDLPEISMGEASLSVSDHALVSQVFLQHLLTPMKSHLWAVAVGAHHGKPKGRIAKINGPECLSEWTHGQRMSVAKELLAEFGSLPDRPPDDRLKPFHSDLWLLAGLITVADWIGSNELWFSPETGMTLCGARERACEALRQIGWPGGKLRQTAFSVAFGEDSPASFQPNPIQCAVAEASQTAGIIIVEGPMGCGKTEAALFAAQHLIVSGHQHGIYFALPTQVTSNRIHERIGRFLRNTLAHTAKFRLAHSQAWLEDDFDLQLNPAYPARKPEENEEILGTLREARSWFSSAKQALLAPYGVGTVDQALQAVVAVKHFFVRRFALAGKVVVLDEVHSYDIYTGTLITALIHELINLRCSVIILSATLTAARRRELLEAAGVTETVAPAAYPLVTNGALGETACHTVPEWKIYKSITLRPEIISEEETLSELISRSEAGQHVLWIRNTVIEAQDAFRKIAGSVREGAARIGLLHSRFPFQRRAELEDDWLERLGRNRPAEGPGSVLVATQIVEQSVDIDLDFIVSDLAPTDMLLQRVGRLWRHERKHRHADTPEFWIRLPALSATFCATELKKTLGRSAQVYAPYVLLRTASVWGGQTELALPNDIRPLLEATYSAAGASESEAWQQLHADLESEKLELAANANAATLVLGRPMLQDEDAVLTRRKSAPTTPVVLLRSIEQGSDGDVLLGALDGSSLKISERDWRKGSARFLYRWLVRVPRWMIPAATLKPRWLALHTSPDTTVALVREDGRLSIDNVFSSVTYNPQVGIFAECPGKTNPQWNHDDEFDN